MKIKRNIIIMCAISLLQGMVFYAPIATLYRQAAGISIFQITIIESISMVLSMVLEVPWGIAADKIGYKKTLLICCGVYVVSKLVFWRADGFGMFLVERIQYFWRLYLQAFQELMKVCCTCQVETSSHRRYLEYM